MQLPSLSYVAFLAGTLSPPTTKNPDTTGIPSTPTPTSPTTNTVITATQPTTYRTVCKVGQHGEFNSSDGNPGEQSGYNICANYLERYLLLGFHEAPHDNPVTVQAGNCLEHNQPVLTSCTKDSLPCLTVVSSRCACVRFITPTPGKGDVNGKFVAFGKRTQNIRQTGK